MNAATTEGRLRLRATQERESRTAKGTKGTKRANGVNLGPYTYIPAPMQSSAAANGTLMRGGFPVALTVTEPLLREFLDVMSELEADLTQRWVKSEGLYTSLGAK